jgi:hypothetical protein
MPPVFEKKKKAAAILATVLLLDDLEEERIKKKEVVQELVFKEKFIFSYEIILMFCILLCLLYSLRGPTTHRLFMIQSKQ